MRKIAIIVIAILLITSAILVRHKPPKHTTFKSPKIDYGYVHNEAGTLLVKKPSLSSQLLLSKIDKKLYTCTPPSHKVLDNGHSVVDSDEICRYNHGLVSHSCKYVYQPGQLNNNKTQVTVPCYEKYGQLV